MKDTPRIPVGSSAKLNLDRRNHDAIYHRGRGIQSTSSRIQQNARGFRVTVLPRPRHSAGLVQLFQLMSVEADYLVCRDLSIAEDGSRTTGDIDIFIAKDPKLRNSVTSEWIDGVEYTYAYEANFTERTSSTTGEDDEIQVVVPYYIPYDDTDEENIIDGDLIFAVETTGTGVWRTVNSGDPDEYKEEITLLELSSRAWAKKA